MTNLIYRRTSSLESSAQTLVNTVNCVGVMGKGLAKAHRDQEPEMFQAYKKICDQDLLRPGMLWLWKGKRNWILNFPTKKHWRHPSKIEWIEAGLAKFVATYEDKGISEISFPKLGCGNGGLDWSEVQPMMEEYLSRVDIPVFIHDFTKDIGVPEHLDRVAKDMQPLAQRVGSFDEFIEAIGKATDLAGGSMVDLVSSRTFSATIEDGPNLSLRIGDDELVLDEEGLLGVWSNFRRGFLTLDEAGWISPAASSSILSILSTLPGARAIEIERISGIPELALEIAPPAKSGRSVPEKGDQGKLEWA